MYSLSLGIEGDLLSFVSSSSYVSPVISATYKQSFSLSDIVEDVILLTLQNDDVSVLTTFITQLDEVINRINLYKSRPVVDQSVVIYKQNSTDDAYRSLIISLFYEPLGISIEEISTGSLLINLHLTRPNFWLGPEKNLPLSNANGSHVTTPLTIHNHNDSVHDNFVNIDPADFESDLPCPLRINLVNTTSSDSLRNLFAFLNINSNPLSPPGLLECEAATGGTIVPSTSASGGSYKSLTWSDVDETLLLTWLITSAISQKFGNNYFKYILRLFNIFTYTNLWFKLKIAYPTASNIIGETDWILGKPGEALQEFPVMQLPPCPSFYSDFCSPFYLLFYAYRSTADTHLLDVDYLHAYALDGFYKAEALFNLSNSWNLLFNSYSDLLLKHPDIVAYSAGIGFVNSHILYGQPIFIYPSRPACLSFLHDTDTGLSPIDRTCTVQAWYRPMKRFI